MTVCISNCTLCKLQASRVSFQISGLNRCVLIRNGAYKCLCLLAPELISGNVARRLLVLGLFPTCVPLSFLLFLFFLFPDKKPTFYHRNNAGSRIVRFFSATDQFADRLLVARFSRGKEPRKKLVYTCHRSILTLHAAARVDLRAIQNSPFFSPTPIRLPRTSQLPARPD